MTRRLSALLLAVAASIALALGTTGCTSGGSNKLDGTVYASHVPVYSPATPDGQIGGTSYGDTPKETSEGQSWFFKTDQPMDQVLAFYEKSLPGWTRTEDRTGDGPYVTFTHTPEGGRKDDYVQVIVREGRVQNSESYRPGKNKSS